MADGDDREIGHAGERAVHGGLVLQVERARRLVEDGEIQGDIGRYREVYGDIGRSSALVASSRMARRVRVRVRVRARVRVRVRVRARVRV